MIKKNVTFILLLLTLVVLFPTTIIEAAVGDFSTIASLEPVVQGQQVNLPQGGTNGTASWSFCNITRIINPNHHSLISNTISMSKIGESFNYTLPGSNTSILGNYIVEGYCGDGYNLQSFAYTFPVTTTGRDNSLSLWITIVLFAFSIILLVLAFYLDNIYIAFLSSVLWIILGMLVYFDGLGNISDMYTQAIAMVTLAVGLMIFFAASFHHSDDEGIAKAFGLDKQEEGDDYDYFK